MEIKRFLGSAETGKEVTNKFVYDNMMLHEMGNEVRKMINIYMCEDDEMQLDHLSKLFEEYLQTVHREARIVSKRSSPEHLMDDIKENGDIISLFFMDVQLNGYSMDGFQLAKAVRRKLPSSYIVFLTSKEELAYEVFENEIEVLDYIVKIPSFFLHHQIDERLKMRLDKVFEKIAKKESERGEEKLLIECGSRIMQIPVKDILYIHSLKVERQVEICCENQRVTVRDSLRKIYDRLGDGFLYVNKSCVVQLAKIQEICRDNRYVILKNGWQLEVSFREMKNVVEKFCNRG